jgi:hypothetical protein
VTRDVGENARERAQAKAIVVRDRDVMLSTAVLGGQADMASGLTHDSVPIATEQVGEVTAREIARKAAHG